MTLTELPVPCFHCGEACADPRTFQVQIDGRSLPVCCAGCKAVAELIFTSGLERYYQFREGEAKRALEGLDQFELAWAACDSREDLWGMAVGGGRRDLLLQTEGVHCSACGWLIRTRLEPLPGVERVNVDIATGYTRVLWNPAEQSLSRIALELARIGYRPHLPIGGSEEQGRLEERRRALRRLGVAGLGMMQVMMYAVGLYAGESLGISRGARGFLEWTSLLVTIPVVFYSGGVFFRGALDSIRMRRPGMDVPVALAITVAFSASCVNFLRGSGQVYFDSVVMFVFFLSVARYLQMASRHSNLQAGNALARLLPEWAVRMNDGEPEQIPASDLVVDDQVRVRTGEPFPADGIIEQGATEVDEALLTGESRLLARGPGDAVVGGSINRTQPVTLRVTATGDETTVSALGRMLLRARAQSSRMASLSDQVAGWFVLAVLVLATLTGVFWWWQDRTMVMQAVLAVLVISCPCALALATPTALAAAGRALLRRGILLTRGDALEATAMADTIVFDKTGTLTMGEPGIAGTDINTGRLGINIGWALSVAASLEAHSSHPLAQAFSTSDPLFHVSNVRNHEHRGISGRIDKVEYRLGSAEFVEIPQNLAGNGNSDIWLADEHGWIARFGIEDDLRPDAKKTVNALRAGGLEMMILSGDGPQAVERVAERLGIDDWQARQDPEMKLERVQMLQNGGARVVMIGDGVNDAPVLAAASASMAVQGASELANSAADLVLNGQSLELVLHARETAMATRRIIRQNMAWALAYNALALPLAASGQLQPWMAALGMSLSSLLVVGNSMRLVKA